MAELDKKVQKAQTDLVQSVLEAQEKRNIERVEMLVTNAIKQLKMSRFKPDQTTCLSLTYLARISPKVFLQSCAIKDVLKSLLRRDNGPANIKGTKNDIVLPVLAANILLACCDATEIRTIILHKIEQWLSSNQKITEMVQHLLATLCMKCQADPQTITSLVEMRQHWLQYLDENFDLYGPVPVDLCASVRQLLHTETSCESLVICLRFLIKHDTDIIGLGRELSKFIVERPISLDSMLKKEESGIQLNRIILKTFIKLFAHLKSSPNIDNPPKPASQSETRMETDEKSEEKQKTDAPKTEFPGVMVKLEPKDESESIKLHPGELKKELKPETKVKQDVPFNGTTKSDTTTKSDKAEPPKGDDDSTMSSSETSPNRPIQHSLYVQLPSCTKVIPLSRLTIEAVLSLMALVEVKEECKEEFSELLDLWLVGGKINQLSTIYEDYALTTVYNLPDKLRQKLVHSTNELLVEFGLRGANAGQLIRLIQQFGSPVSTINQILKHLESTKDIELIRSEIKDPSYFGQLMKFYSDMGALNALEFSKRLDHTLN